MNWKEMFPQFEPGLIDIIEKNAIQKKFKQEMQKFIQDK